MFQVLVKTTPRMQGSYPYDLGTREAAQEFVKRADVWWWVFPIDEDVLDGDSWHRGGAWSQEQRPAQSQGSDENHGGNALSGPRRGPVTFQEFADEEEEEVKRVKFRPITQAEEEEDDDRWLTR